MRIKKGWAILALVVSLGIASGCKETQDHGEEAKAVLRGTATPGAAKESPSPQTKSEPRLLHASSPKYQTPPSSPPKERELLEKMGIEAGHGRLVIDTNRTRSFLEALTAQFQRGVDRGVEKAKRHTSEVEDIGIHIDEDRVEIDLNKTKNFLKVWGEAMEILGEEMKDSLEPPQ